MAAGEAEKNTTSSSSSSMHDSSSSRLPAGLRLYDTQDLEVIEHQLIRLLRALEPLLAEH
jgi:hypothetical protein